MAGYQADITVRKTVDALTGLPNRQWLEAELSAGGRPGVLIHVFFPAPVVNNLILSLTVHQNAAKMYGQPVLCTAANGC